MAFDSRDTAAFSGIWVFCEQRGGEIQTISHQLLSEGRKLANDLGTDLCGVVLGSGVDKEEIGVVLHDSQQCVADGLNVVVVVAFEVKLNRSRCEHVVHLFEPDLRIWEDVFIAL